MLHYAPKKYEKIKLEEAVPRPGGNGELTGRAPH
jgi:hypothetical protein